MFVEMFNEKTLDLSAEFSKMTGIEKDKKKLGKGDVYFLKDNSSVVIGAEKGRIQYYDKNMEYVTSYTRVTQAIKALGQAGVLFESTGTFMVVAKEDKDGEIAKTFVKASSEKEAMKKAKLIIPTAVAAVELSPAGVKRMKYGYDEPIYESKNVSEKTGGNQLGRFIMNFRDFLNEAKYQLKMTDSSFGKTVPIVKKVVKILMDDGYTHDKDNVFHLTDKNIEKLFGADFLKKIQG